MRPVAGYPTLRGFRKAGIDPANIETQRAILGAEAIDFIVTIYAALKRSST